MSEATASSASEGVVDDNSPSGRPGRSEEEQTGASLHRSVGSRGCVWWVGWWWWWGEGYTGPATEFSRC